VTVLLKPATRAGFRDVRFVMEVPNAKLDSPSTVYVPAGREEPRR
jgi:hypothetical protein